MTSKFVAIASGSLVLAQLPHAHAQTKEEGSAFRLSMSAPILYYFTASSEENGVEVTDSRASFGIPAEAANIGLGMSPNRNLNYGLELNIGSQSSKTEVEDTVIVEQEVGLFGVSPYVEGVFADTGTSRGFIRGQLTFASATTRVGDSSDETEVDVFRVAAGGGVQFFPTEQLSIDARVDLAYASVTYSADSLADDLDASGIGVIGVFGISGWFGRRDPAPPSAEEELALDVSEDAGAPPSPSPRTRRVGSLPPVSDGSVIEREGVVTLSLRDNVRVRLEPTATRGGPAFIVIMVPPSFAEGKDCAAAAYYDGETEHSNLGLSAEKVMRGSEELTVLSGEVPLDALAAIGRRQRTDTGFWVCDERLNLSDRQRQALRAFKRDAEQ